MENTVKKEVEEKDVPEYGEIREFHWEEKQHCAIVMFNIRDRYTVGVFWEGNDLGRAEIMGCKNEVSAQAEYERAKNKIATSGLAASLQYKWSSLQEEILEDRL